MKIIFAFALNSEKQFQNKHFGEAETYAFYEYKNKQISFLEEAENQFLQADEEIKHGSAEKAGAIISFLKEKGVSVLVSKQFGKNVKRVSEHFIPVIISEENPGEVEKILEEYIKWIADELKNRSSNYMLFRINTGILKMAV